MSTGSGAVKEQWYTKLTKNLVSDKYKAAFIGVTVILVLVVIAAIVGLGMLRGAYECYSSPIPLPFR